MRWLVARIQENALYADHLKYGYFLRRWPGQWPIEAALCHINDQLDLEERNALLAMTDFRPREGAGSKAAFTASRSWISLASVAAFAQMHNPRLGDGMTAYGRLWEQGDDLNADPDLFCRALSDFTGAIIGRGKAGDNAAARRQAKSWLPAWLSVATFFDREPEIGRFAEQTGSWSLFENEIGKAGETLGDQFTFSRRVALFFYGTSSAPASSGHMAIHLDRAVKSADFPEQSVEIRCRLLDAYADALERQSLWDEAIAMQRTALDDAGGSLIRMARLCHRSGLARQSGRVNTADQDPMGPTNDETREDRQSIRSAEFYFSQRDSWLERGKDNYSRRGEVFDRAVLLVELGRREEAERFLNGFLGASDRKDAQQLSATVLLSHLYMQEKRFPEARAVLAKLDFADYPPSPETMPHLTRLLAIRSQLAEAPL